ncbi:uncharacterized protein CTRU02_208314 [Colletotrichum truncatum]|uniref:Uncharacterized protein n=1 Tax=Colletotrichum truncatum TaxID=5467 RepID=A0ACC3YW47_COLTU|nr:uncharacterized protein CTRU02_07505 [Colletotrichum truncatum]KAF6791165.1 hypothetical protein CTRU02_07505 [Colletotrichum truncatum]
MTTTSPTNNPLTTQRGAAPLTTVFTTPDFCKSGYWTDTITPPLSSIVCMPTSWKQVYDYQWGFYSPGICPMGYTEGCAFPTASAYSKDGMVRLGGSVIPNETPRICCPTGHTCYTGTDWAYSKCQSTIPTRSFYDINNKPTSDLATVYAVQVRWQASDLSNLETDPTVPGATYSGPRSTATNSGVASASASATAAGSGSGTAGAGATTSVASTATPEGSTGGGTSGGGGISVGTTIAIAVGSVAGTLALALIGFVIFWRRRKGRERRNSNSDTKSDTSLAPPALAAHKGGSGKTSLDLMSPDTATTASATLVTPHSPNPNATHLDSTTLMEMETFERPQELPEDNYVVELEGDMPGPPLYREKEGWPLRS